MWRMQYLLSIEIYGCALFGFAISCPSHKWDGKGYSIQSTFALIQSTILCRLLQLTDIEEKESTAPLFADQIFLNSVAFCEGIEDFVDTVGSNCAIPKVVGLDNHYRSLRTNVETGS